MSQDWADIHHRAVSWDRAGIPGSVPADVRALGLVAPDWATEHRSTIASPKPPSRAKPQFALTSGAMLFLHRMRERGRDVICKSEPIYVKCIRVNQVPEYICMQCEAHVTRVENGPPDPFAYWVIYIDRDYVPGEYASHPFVGVKPLREEPPHNTRDRFRTLAGILPMSKFVRQAFEDLEKSDPEFTRDGIPDEDNITLHRNHRIIELMKNSELPDARALR